ncbi:MAG: glycosyltransferase family 4 protein [Alistipes sp.]|nr:glycosyltransferase family 4 protein [Rikenellaceae bacterium]MBR3792984.1 glycosyltransferase family 4 protein [Alistipes sp.]
MNTALTLIIIAAILIVIELLYFRIADHFNIIDKPNLRSSHSHITLRGGGIIFLASIWICSLFFGLTYPWFMAGLTAICAISFIDDIHSVPNHIRLLVHFASMALMFQQWNILTAENWWQIIPALILCTGIINAYNFMDGINGITGAYSVAVLVPLMVVNHDLNFIDSQLLSVALIGVLVFCLFNFRKRARCFAGDVGSVGIAFVLVFALGALIIANGQLWYLIFLAVYGVDAILTICHRLMLHENIFEAHRKHVYQLMANELKIPHTVVSLIYLALQLIISLGAIWLPINKWIYFVGVIAILTGVYILFKHKYYHLHEEYLKSKEN